MTAMQHLARKAKGLKKSFKQPNEFNWRASGDRWKKQQKPPFLEGACRFLGVAQGAVSEASFLINSRKELTMTERLLRPTDAASLVRNIFKRPLSVAYLAKLRCVGGSPPYVLSGRFIAYPESELIAHFARQVSKPMDSTSSAVQPASSDAIFDIDDRDLEDEGPYSHLFTGDKKFDAITKEEFSEFDIDLEMERAEKRWQFN
ncbi:MAG: hypothetical protein K2X10_11735 [Hyphomicrobiales bacterium]|nr:hypothetical protein [Hyphomicrobiales bacterium]